MRRRVSAERLNQIARAREIRPGRNGQLSFAGRQKLVRLTSAVPGGKYQALVQVPDSIGLLVDSKRELTCYNLDGDSSLVGRRVFLDFDSSGRAFFRHNQIAPSAPIGTIQWPNCHCTVVGQPLWYYPETFTLTCKYGSYQMNWFDPATDCNGVAQPLNPGQSWYSDQIQIGSVCRASQGGIQQPEYLPAKGRFRGSPCLVSFNNPLYLDPFLSYPNCCGDILTPVYAHQNNDWPNLCLDYPALGYYGTYNVYFNHVLEKSNVCSNLYVKLVAKKQSTNLLYANPSFGTQCQILLPFVEDDFAIITQ